MLFQGESPNTLHIPHVGCRDTWTQWCQSGPILLVKGSFVFLHQDSSTIVHEVEEVSYRGHSELARKLNKVTQSERVERQDPQSDEEPNIKDTSGSFWRSDQPAGETIETQELLTRLAPDDFTSFYELWGCCQPYLYKVCLRKMSGRREEAEDALSRAMLTAWERLPRHAHTIRDIRAWLTRLTRNLCVDILRERQRHDSIFERLDELSASEQQLLASIETPEESVLRHELNTCLRCSIDDLPPKLRAAFRLRFIHEMSYLDISAHLNLTTANIRKRVQQARTILRQKLREYDPAHEPASPHVPNQQLKRSHTDAHLIEN
jgi:RNA polymerase sigma-70 factor (ECF subfamily)